MKTTGGSGRRFRPGGQDDDSGAGFQPEGEDTPGDYGRYPAPVRVGMDYVWPRGPREGRRRFGRAMRGRGRGTGTRRMTGLTGSRGSRPRGVGTCAAFLPPDTRARVPPAPTGGVADLGSLEDRAGGEERPAAEDPRASRAVHTDPGGEARPVHRGRVNRPQPGREHDPADRRGRENYRFAGRPMRRSGRRSTIRCGEPASGTGPASGMALRRVLPPTDASPQARQRPLAPSLATPTLIRPVAASASSTPRPTVSCTTFNIAPLTQKTASSDGYIKSTHQNVNQVQSNEDRRKDRITMPDWSNSMNVHWTDVDPLSHSGY